MKVMVEGKGEVVLTKNDYVAAGGEGQIYAKVGTAYKIYADKKKSIPQGKIKELSVLKNKNIINPQHTIKDAKNNAIGYTMKFLKSNISLCQLFTKAFKNRNNIGPADILKLVNQFRDNIKYCHDNAILLVDVNELNFLVKDKTFDELYFIDVDSYQTQHYPATALMESVRDRHNKTFSEGTDWFSFGILSFQMFVGIHPFKGRHEIYQTMDERMINNISVLNEKVRVPMVAGNFDVIPENYLQWYKAIFESNTRITPPFNENMTVIVGSTMTWNVSESNQHFAITLVKELHSPIVFFLNKDVVLTTDGLCLKSQILPNVAPYSFIIHEHTKNNIISAIVKDDKLSLWNATANTVIDINLSAEKLFICNGMLYYQWEDGIYVVDFTMIGAKQIVGSIRAGNVLTNSTQVFDGVVVQDLLGSYFISIYQYIHHYQVKIPELDGYRIIDARYEDKVLVVIAELKGVYDEFIFILSDDLLNYNKNYVCRKNSGVSYTGINFTVNDRGICVKETCEGFIEVFRNSIDSTDVKLIKDQALAGSKLFHEGHQILFSKENKLYNVSMK